MVMTEEHHGSSSRQSSRLSSVSPHRGENLFSDENAIEPISVANSPQTSFNLQNISLFSQRELQRSSSFRDTTTPPRESKNVPLPMRGPSQRLNSRNSFSLRHDAQYSDAPRRIPSISSTRGPNERIDTTRTSTLLSRESASVRPQSTYNGPSAPSHPYGMYPQTTTEISRRASVASSYRPIRERSFHGGERPRHPYTMYPQVTASSDEIDPLNTSADIASIGFPGMRQQYRRRLGPDGEEADDIIGPDGHTEQLPPYTKYAITAPMPPKIQTHETNVPSSSSSTQEAYHAANSATSMSDRLLPPITYGSSPEVGGGGSQSIGPHRQKWSEKSKKRTCFGRLPLWVVVMIIVALIIMSAVMGGVIGRLLAKQKASSDHRNVNQTSETTSSIPLTFTTSETPSRTFGPFPMSSSSTGPSDTPTGNYGLLVNSPSGKSDSCLDAKQQMAWTCMDGPTRLEISVQNPKTSAATVELTSSDSSQSSLSYGDQHPVIQGKVSASYNFDPEARDFGAALYFHAVYEKRVLLSFDEITALPSKRSMEDASIIEKSRISPRTTNKIPDEALVWDCRWPNTDIDGYIYVNEPTPGDAANAIPSGIATPTPTSPTRRGVTKVTKSQTPTDLYRRKVKIAEYRNQATPTPSCTLRQLCKSELVAPLAPSHGPKEIILHESISPHQKRTGLPQWDQDASVYETRAATGGGSCYCVWITT